MIRRPPRSTLSSSSAASDVYKRQVQSRRTSDFGHARMGPKHPHGPSNSAIVVQVRRVLRRGGDMGSYQETFRRSIDDPEGFWGEAARGLSWYQAPTQVLDRSNPPFYRWFPDGVLNTCYNAVDRHVEGGRGDQVAIIHDSAVTSSQRKITYAELLEQVSRFAGVLAGLGVIKGDRVVIYMPMIPETLVAMLACARIGAVHSVVFGGFAPHELAIRIDDARPRVVISASCGIEGQRVIEYKPFLDAAIAEAENKPERCVIFQRPQATAALGGLHWYAVGRAGGRHHLAPVEVTATEGGGGLRALEDDAALGLVLGFRYGRVQERLVLDHPLALDPAGRGDHYARPGIVDADGQLVRGEAAKDH